jgi:hypothetical protein
MRLSALLASLTLVAMLFAGCAGDNDGEGDGASTSTSGTASRSTSGSATTSRSSTGTTTSSGTTSTGPAANHAPTGSVSAVVNGTEVAFALAGEDQDGDDLSWELSFGDASAATTGTTLPANVTHEYAAGNFTANFTVSDGQTTASYEVDVGLSAGGGSQAVVLAGHVVLPDPFAQADFGCLMDAGRRDSGTPAGYTGQDHPIDAAQWGWTYALDVAGMIAEYWSTATILGHGNSGTVPADAAYVVICISDPTAADSDYQLTLTPA